MPRALPTDDVLILRDKKGDQASGGHAPTAPTAASWKGPLTLDVVEGVPRPAGPAPVVGRSAEAAKATPVSEGAGVVLVLTSLDEVRAAVERADLVGVRAIVAPFVPSTAVSALASEGIATFTAPAAELDALKGQRSLALPAPTQWGDTVPATVGKRSVLMAWLATGLERAWTHAGTARTTTKPSR